MASPSLKADRPGSRFRRSDATMITKSPTVESNGRCRHRVQAMSSLFRAIRRAGRGAASRRIDARSRFRHPPENRQHAERRQRHEDAGARRPSRFFRRGVVRRPARVRRTRQWRSYCRRRGHSAEFGVGKLLGARDRTDRAYAAREKCKQDRSARSRSRSNGDAISANEAHGIDDAAERQHDEDGRRPKASTARPTSGVITMTASAADRRDVQRRAFADAAMSC